MSVFPRTCDDYVAEGAQHHHRRVLRLSDRLSVDADVEPRGDHRRSGARLREERSLSTWPGARGLCLLHIQRRPPPGHGAQPIVRTRLGRRRMALARLPANDGVPLQDRVRRSYPYHLLPHGVPVHAHVQVSEFGPIQLHGQLLFRLHLL